MFNEIHKKILFLITIILIATGGFTAAVNNKPSGVNIFLPMLKWDGFNKTCLGRPVASVLGCAWVNTPTVKRKETVSLSASFIHGCFCEAGGYIPYSDLNINFIEIRSDSPTGNTLCISTTNKDGVASCLYTIPESHSLGRLILYVQIPNTSIPFFIDVIE